MFGIGTSEFLVIMIVAVLVLGPEHLPRIMRTVNKVMSDFRKVSTDFQRTINLEAYNEEQRATQKSAPKKKKKKKKVPPAEQPVDCENKKPATETTPDPVEETPPAADELAAEAMEATSKKTDMPGASDKVLTPETPASLHESQEVSASLSTSAKEDAPETTLSRPLIKGAAD